MSSGLPGTVVVFGASGFIGRNLVDALRNAGPAIIGVTHKTPRVDGCATTVTFDRLAALPAFDPADAAVIHAAAHRYDAVGFAAQQSRIMAVNAGLASTAYDFCAARGVKEMRLISSVAVYPAAWDRLDDERPVDLNAAPNPGEIAYAWSKRWGEICAETYRQTHAINTVTLRLTNPYGLYDSTDVERAHVAAAFVMKALSPAPVFEIKGSPGAERDFVYAGDVAEVVRRSLVRRGLHGAFNVAQGSGTTIEELAKAVLAASGANKKIVTVGAGGSVQVRRATGAKVRREFGHEKFVDLAEGLKRTMQWYRHALAR